MGFHTTRLELPRTQICCGRCFGLFMSRGIFFESFGLHPGLCRTLWPGLSHLTQYENDSILPARSSLTAAKQSAWYSARVRSIGSMSFKNTAGCFFSNLRMRFSKDLKRINEPPRADVCLSVSSARVSRCARRRQGLLQ